MFSRVLINFGVLIILLFYTAVQLYNYKSPHSPKILCNKWNRVAYLQAKVFHFFIIIIVDHQSTIGTPCEQ